VKALVLNALGRGFDFEDVDIAAPIGREVLVDVQASGCVTPTCSSPLTISFRRPRCSVTRSQGS
jgi:Zn-dependent alcohol dehydrogenase